MRFREISLDLLLPIQTNLRRDQVLEKYACFNYSLLHPLLVFPYQDKYILGDGHHRACCLYLRRERKAYAGIIETSWEVFRCLKGGFRYCWTSKGFRKKYEQDWAPGCKMNGFTSIQDLVERYQLI